MNHAAPPLLSLAIAAAIALAAFRARALTSGGAIAATAVGGAALAVAWSWGALLLAWFALASMLSAVGRTTKSERMLGIVEKGSRRDVRQVLANGGVFLIAACLVIFVTPPLARRDEWNGLLSVVAAASLAAAGADTWATEVGTLYGGIPWSVRSWGRVPIGTSGAVTLAGTLALVAGAILIATLAALFEMIVSTPAMFAAAAVGGIAGALLDTVFGAWLQERRWCGICAMETEQHVHVCGNTTEWRRGVLRLDNDAVNAMCALSGALVAAALLLV